MQSIDACPEIALCHVLNSIRVNQPTTKGREPSPQILPNEIVEKILRLTEGHLGYQKIEHSPLSIISSIFRRVLTLDMVGFIQFKRLEQALLSGNIEEAKATLTSESSLLMRPIFWIKEEYYDQLLERLILKEQYDSLEFLLAQSKYFKSIRPIQYAIRQLDHLEEGKRERVMQILVKAEFTQFPIQQDIDPRIVSWWTPHLKLIAKAIELDDVLAVKKMAKHAPKLVRLRIPNDNKKELDKWIAHLHPIANDPLKVKRMIIALRECDLEYVTNHANDRLKVKTVLKELHFRKLKFNQIYIDTLIGAVKDSAKREKLMQYAQGCIGIGPEGFEARKRNLHRFDHLI
jgi:hypothetical protein